jgi:2-keto-4-pentenoate hydratase
MTPGDPRIVSGLEAQAAARAAVVADGATRLGWKAGFGTAAAFRTLGTQAPLVGFLTDATLLADGATCSVASWRKPMLEPEIAVRVGRDLPAGASPEHAAEAIDAIAPAIELVDLAEAGTDVEAILAGNVFHRAVLLGAFTPLDASTALADARVDVRGAACAEQADPTEVLGPLAEIVRHLADALPLAQDGMRAGDVVITGSAVPAIAVSPGERVEVAIGAVSVTVTLG